MRKTLITTSTGGALPPVDIPIYCHTIEVEEVCTNINQRHGGWKTINVCGSKYKSSSVAAIAYVVANNVAANTHISCSDGPHNKPNSEGWFKIPKLTKLNYIRGSTKRIIKSKKAMKDVAFETKRFLCGKYPTRSNSTFKLCEVSLRCPKYIGLERVPEHWDFNEIKRRWVSLKSLREKRKNLRLQQSL
ncbi:hypothetical protein LXL04_017736 [Taraxacum kok-saghyz]